MAGEATTRERLLDAAGREFAEKGYDAASIRGICDRVRANVAAVNYYFGNKEQLYLAALLEAHRCGTETIPDAVMQTGTPAEKLQRFIHHFLENVVVIGQGGTWHHALMLREMIQPTAALQVLVREAIRPKFDRLLGILREACPSADERQLHAMAFSVVGQCLHYRMAAAVNVRLVGEATYQELDLEFLSDHISGVCLAALGLGPPVIKGVPAKETRSRH
jgi:AcrR family transcriptional regulator